MPYISVRGENNGRAIESYKKSGFEQIKQIRKLLGTWIQGEVFI